MRKTSIIRFDKERNKYRVDTGRRLNTYIARKPDLRSAIGVSLIVDKAYKEGYNDGYDEGYCEGYVDAIFYIQKRLRDFLFDMGGTIRPSEKS